MYNIPSYCCHIALQSLLFCSDPGITVHNQPYTDSIALKHFIIAVLVVGYKGFKISIEQPLSGILEAGDINTNFAEMCIYTLLILVNKTRYLNTQ